MADDIFVANDRNTVIVPTDLDTPDWRAVQHDLQDRVVDMIDAALERDSEQVHSLANAILDARDRIVARYRVDVAPDARGIAFQAMGHGDAGDALRKRLRIATDEQRALMGTDAPGKIVTFLRMGNGAPRTNKEIADGTGLHPATVARLMPALRSDGMVVSRTVGRHRLNQLPPEPIAKPNSAMTIMGREPVRHSLNDELARIVNPVASDLTSPCTSAQPSTTGTALNHDSNAAAIVETALSAIRWRPDFAVNAEEAAVEPLPRPRRVAVPEMLKLGEPRLKMDNCNDAVPIVDPLARRFGEEAFTQVSKTAAMAGL